MSRKYLDVYELLDKNPGLTPAEAGRQLGYKAELHWKSKKDRRVGPKHRHSDGQRALSEEQQRIGPKNIPPSQPGFDRHHKRMIMLYRPLYEGLSEADALKLSQHALDVGMPLGDVGANYQLLPKEVHNKIHRYMEKEGMRPSQMPDFSKADLPNRIKAFDALYKDFLQPDIDKQLDNFQQQYSTGVDVIDFVLNKNETPQQQQFSQIAKPINTGVNLILRAANRVQTALDIFNQGRSGSLLDQSLNAIPDTSETDLGRHLGNGISNGVENGVNGLKNGLKNGQKFVDQNGISSI